MHGFQKLLHKNKEPFNFIFPWTLWCKCHSILCSVISCPVLDGISWTSCHVDAHRYAAFLMFTAFHHLSVGWGPRGSLNFFPVTGHSGLSRGRSCTHKALRISGNVGDRKCGSHKWVVGSSDQSPVILQLLGEDPQVLAAEAACWPLAQVVCLQRAVTHSIIC